MPEGVNAQSCMHRVNIIYIYVCVFENYSNMFISIYMCRRMWGYEYAGVVMCAHARINIYYVHNNICTTVTVLKCSLSMALSYKLSAKQNVVTTLQSCNQTKGLSSLN